MEQYQRIKNQHPNEILFFRLGDFYEMFYEDAKIASKVLGIVLTSRFKEDKAIPMAGVPYHSVLPYINKLLKAGYKVAVCEQVQEADEAVGLVEREVVRVITPGTLTEENLLNEKTNNFLTAIFIDKSSIGISAIDISTGRFIVEDVSEADITDEILRLGPSECLVQESIFENPPEFVKSLQRTLNLMLTARDDWTFDKDNAKRILREHFQVDKLEGFGIEDGMPSLRSAGAIFEYLKETQKVSLKHITKIEKREKTQRLFLDKATQVSLELVRTIREVTEQNSLLDILDKTVTAMGARYLRELVTLPFLKVEDIQYQQGGVVELWKNRIFRESVQQILKSICDIERITAKLGTGRANPRDMVALNSSLKLIPPLKSKLSNSTVKILTDIYNQTPTLDNLVELLDKSIVDDPPMTLKEGGIIKSNFSEELDKVKALSSNAKEWIASFQSREIKRTGINSLKVGFNKVFGYYIEVTNVHSEKIPSDYIRKQTIKNAERYITPELKEYETQILNAEEKIKELEYELFLEIRKKAEDFVPELQMLGSLIGKLDVLCSLAQISDESDYCVPVIHNGTIIKIKDGRHPVIEKSVSERFVPNDVLLNCEDQRVLIITGPNMAGKSTYIRQVALIIIMAQMGCGIPATEAEIGVVDRIFTRIGAADELAKGNSTFMVEMCETANILNNATQKSLLVLDEIGRGTSTFDGLSIALAVVEHVHDRIGARTLFATHYHELTDLTSVLPGVKNYYVSVKEWKEKIIFLRRILPGSSDKSYGIYVAKLAGIPQPVVTRAKSVLIELEKLNEQAMQDLSINPKNSGLSKFTSQLPLFVPSSHPVLEKIKSIDVESLKPVEALNILSMLKEMLYSK